MKVIDLLVAISKGEEVPKHILFDNTDYFLEEKSEIQCFIEECIGTGTLNDEIEVIEEPKKIENLPYCEENTFKNIKECSYLSVEEKRLLDSNFKSINEKFNEIIDYINEMEK